MAANQPRIQITPGREVAPLLRELAKLLGQPQSRVVAELLDEAAPALRMSVEALRTVKRSPEVAKALMDNYATKAINELTQQQMAFGQALKKKPGRKPKGSGGRKP